MSDSVEVGLRDRPDEPVVATGARLDFEQMVIEGWRARGYKIPLPELSAQEVQDLRRCVKKLFPDLKDGP